MKRLIFLFSVLLVFSCEDGSMVAPDGSAFSSEDGTSDGSGSIGDSTQSGLITAGEWSDLDNWDFWKDISETTDFEEMADYWGIHSNYRVSVEVKDAENKPAKNAIVELRKGETTEWTAMTDNSGTAELWFSLFEKTTNISAEDFSLWVNGSIVSENVMFFHNGFNSLTTTINLPVSNDVEVCYIVDATGSMSDELEFLKDDLEYVINSVEQELSDISISTATVFYRDEGDEYVVKHSPFTTSISNTVSFIQEQEASGGGDFPEAVHTALGTALNELEWNTSSRTRIAFLLLDAPPHYQPQIVDQIHSYYKLAAEKGIKIIPVTASGINKETEFLMRYGAISTNSTYTFITNHSGIGNDHIEASVGEYEVEYLNELMIRLIKKFSE